jgi:hypothetical protein
LRPTPGPALALVLTLGLAACGGKPPSEETKVRDLLGKLTKATAKRDYRTLCEDVLAQSLVKDVETAGVPCADALRAGLGGVREPRLKVVRVRVRGNHAVATVHTSAKGQKSSDDTVSLIKSGGWRVASLTNPGGG